MLTVVIVSGPPGAGKTSLARHLGSALSLPVYSRDVIKESLFGSLGWSDRQWSRRLGTAATAILFAMIGDCLRAGASCVVESNFRPAQSDQPFQRLLARTGARAVQVQCGADGAALVARFTERVRSGERHPGHRDATNADEFRDELERGWYDPLALPGPVLRVDTTTFDPLAWDALADDLLSLLRPAHPPERC